MKSKLLEKHICIHNDGDNECECFIEGVEKAREEIQKDIRTVFHLLEGSVDRKEIINYIKEYLL